MPLEMPLHPAERERLFDLRPTLESLGFVLETSASGLEVRGMPPVLSRAEAREFLREALAGRKDDLADMFISMSCKAAIKAGQRLTDDEAAGLLSTSTGLDKAIWLKTLARLPYGAERMTPAVYNEQQALAELQQRRVVLEANLGRQRGQLAALLREWKVPLLIHQPSYNLLNRWVDKTGLLDALEANGTGCIAFTPLAQGLLTGKYLNGIPEGSRAARSSGFLQQSQVTHEKVEAARQLNEIARRRGQTLAEMALAWVLKDERMTSVIVGASSVNQLADNLKALEHLEFTADELKEIEQILPG